MTTYEQIKPLVKSSEVSDNVLKATFRCAQSGTEVQAHAPIQDSSAIGKLKEATGGKFGWVMRSVVGGLMRSVLGRGIMGSIGRELFYGASRGDLLKGTPSEADKQNATLTAFESVVHQFTWDSDTESYVANQGAPQTPAASFGAQISSAPIENDHDRKVVARVLVEVAGADGKVTDEERQFLESFLPPDLGTFDELKALGTVGADVLAQCAPGASRKTIVMLAWAMALSDQELADSEASRIDTLADDLGVSSEESGALRGQAGAFLAQQAAQAGVGADATQWRAQLGLEHDPWS